MFGWNLWGYDLWAPDEPYFAEGAREMLVDGEWAVPHVGGAITTDKPPLFFWLIAVFSLPAGRVTSLTARLPSLLAALGTLALTMRLGRRLYGEGVGSLAGVVLAVSYLFWDKARSSQIDALLCFLVLVALTAFEGFRAGTARGRWAGLLFWTAAALAVLAKGPVGLLLPLGIAVCTLAWDRRLHDWRGFAPSTGPALFALVVGAWMALSTLGSGGEYSVWGALREHVLERGLHGMHHKQPPWYYLHALPRALLPWSFLLPGALVLAWRQRLPADRFLLTWAGFVLAFFTLSTEKRDLYVLPAFPAMALLMARLSWAPPRPRWITVPQRLLGGILVLAGTALPLAATHARSVGDAVAGAAPVVPLAALLGGLLAVGGIALLLLAHARAPSSSVLGAAAVFAAAYLVTAGWILPRFDPVKSARSFALTMKAKTAGGRARGGEVLTHGLGNLTHALSFYSDGVYFRRIHDPVVFAQRLDGEHEVFAVADATAVEGLPPAIRERLSLVASARLSRIDVVLVRAGVRDGD